MPSPDPTALTTQQMHRETEALRELVFRENLSLEKNFGTRMGAIEAAATLVHENITRWPTDLDKGLAHLKELFEEKFVSIAGKVADGTQLNNEKFQGVQKQFEERDVRVTQSAVAATTAVNAALQAAKEAVGEQNKSFTLSIDKSEAAIAKQIDALTQTYQTEIRGMNSTINDLKDRINRNDGAGAGRTAEIVDRRAVQSERRGSSDSNISVIGILIAAAGLIGGIVIAMLKH